MEQGTRRRMRVTGRVQGVGFRWFVREEARRLGLRGWVRNEANGDVLVEVEGPAHEVGLLEDLLRMGPPAAEVSRVSMETPEQTVAERLPFPFAVHR